MLWITNAVKLLVILYNKRHHRLNYIAIVVSGQWLPILLLINFDLNINPIQVSVSLEVSRTNDNLIIEVICCVNYFNVRSHSLHRYSFIKDATASKRYNQEVQEFKEPIIVRIV